MTSGWWQSSIPWGAALRLNAQGDVEFQDDEGKGNWVQATGVNGVLTKALYNYKVKMKEKTNLRAVDAELRAMLIDPATNTLKYKTWEFNDFGRWGWQLQQNGHGTAYFLHTTPLNEASYKADKNAIADLANSHGCIHIDPADRDTFIKKGYLNAGTEFEVRTYKEIGPP